MFIQYIFNGCCLCFWLHSMVFLIVFGGALILLMFRVVLLYNIGNLHILKSYISVVVLLIKIKIHVTSGLYFFCFIHVSPG